MLVYIVFSWFVAPAEVPASVAVAQAKARLSQKVNKIHEEGRSQTTHVVARVFVCRLDQFLAVSAAGSRSVVVARGTKLRAKHVNTCSDDFGAPARVELRDVRLCHTNGGHLCEPGGVKIIVLGALEVKIINVHVFACQLGPIYYVLHI